jgi:hypothetical protein
MATYQAMNNWRLLPRDWRRLPRSDQIELLAVAQRRHYHKMRFLAQISDRLPPGFNELAQVLILLSEM